MYRENSSNWCGRCWKRHMGICPRHTCTTFCAVLYFLDSGAAWRSLPPAFPPWRTVHEYYTQWTLTRGDEPSLLERTLAAIERPAAIEQMRKRAGAGS
jgi:transposase